MEIRIVYMGDSITFGQHCNPDLRWTALLDRVLAKRLGGSPTKLATFNRGESGQTTRQGLERYPADVQQLEPHVVTLQFGMNDCNCWQTDHGLPRVSEQAFRANLAEMVGRARQFGAREIVMATNPRTLRNNAMVSGEVYESANARYSQIVREVAAEVGANLCDIRAGFEIVSEREMAAMVLPDLLHLSETGNALYADLIAPHVLAAVAAVSGAGVAT